MRKLSFIYILSLSIIIGIRVSAQETVTVPDVTGLNVPQAAAELNRAGLLLGNQVAVPWDASTGFLMNIIANQSIAAGSSATSSTAVDITVLRPANIALIYDDNDLTLVNLSTNAININGLSFTVVEGTTASFSANRWQGVLEGGDCGQIWSISRGAAKDVDACQSTQWFTTNDSQLHFWTATNGVLSFAIMDNGVQRAVCDAASSGTQDQPLRCETYVSGEDTSSELTEYSYFVYTSSAFAIINPSSDRWMPSDQTRIIPLDTANSMLGAGGSLGNPALFGNPPVIGAIERLAPNQCLLLTSDNPDSIAPEPCDPIASLNVASSLAFWLNDFQIDSLIDEEIRQCPAAVADKTTVCIMPQ